MGSYRTFVHYVRKKKKKKKPIVGSCGQKFGSLRSKRVVQEVYELDPPPFGTSAENTGTHDLIRYHLIFLCTTHNARTHDKLLS